jgi:hypothetical protein
MVIRVNIVGRMFKRLRFLVIANATVAGGEIPQGNATRVWRLWQAIAAKAHPRQLPLELQGLLG